MSRDPHKTKLWLSSGAGVLLVAAIVAAANFVSHFAYARLDFSRGRVYSVSAATRKILRSLPDNVLIDVYYSRELPPQIAVNKNYLRDLLREYASGAGGKVRSRFVEVGEDPKSREEALKAGISPVRFDIISKEKYEQREGFLGLALQYQDKKETIPFLQDTTGLEYDLTSRIKVMASPSKPVLGFASGFEATSADGLDPAVLEPLSARYELQPVDLASISIDSGIAADVGTLFLIGPQARLPDKALFLLDQFLLSGRSLCVLADTRRVDTRSFFASELDTGLGPWLKHHGLELQSNLVFDAQSQMIQVSMQQGPFSISNIVQYPPIVVASRLNASHPVTKGLDALTLPFVGPIEVSTRAAREEHHLARGTGRAIAPGAAQAAVDVLARSSQYSWTREPKSARAMSLNPFQFPPPGPTDFKGPFVLAAALQDRFTPYWPTPPAELKAKVFLSQAAKPGRLVVVGTSKFLGRDFRASPGNVHFFLNLVDWLAQDADLIAIRSKSVGFHPLREIPAGWKAAVRYTNMFLPPLLAVLAGLWRWELVRRRRAAAARRYGVRAAKGSTAEVADRAITRGSAAAEGCWKAAEQPGD
ncbi:MAG: GldG family protein [Elusimicrobia bacterium]|nr:GldG family protein [Elusimicrobiota bacterium]